MCSMLSYEELKRKATELDEKINKTLAEQEIIKTSEMVMKSKTEYQRGAFIKKLHEKLNLVILSRSKAQESNKRLLSDFDRIQKHLGLMEEKTNLLMAKVNNEKRYLDAHYPNWREKANMFVSPSYITQENMFNMLDSLRCRLKESENVSFNDFTNLTDMNYKGNLADMLDKHDVSQKSTTSVSQRKPTSLKLDKPTFEEQIPQATTPNSVLVNDESSIIVEKNPLVSPENHCDTLTNITESADIPNFTATEEAITPRQTLTADQLDFSESTSIGDPLQNSGFQFQFPSAVEAVSPDDADNEESEGNIENLLNPVKPVKTKIDSPHQEAPSSPHFPDSPGGSVDTVIKSPVKTPLKAKSPVISSLSFNQEHKTQSPPKPRSTKSILERLNNESSDSEILLNHQISGKDPSGPDSEDDFDFFD